MKKDKVINFSSKSVFKALYTNIILFLLFFLLLMVVSMMIKDQLIVCISVYIFFILVLYFIERKTLLNSLKSFKDDIKGKLKNVIIISVTLLVIEFIVNLILIKIIGHSPDNNQTIQAMINTNGPLLCGLYFMILCPLLESIIFFYPYKNVKNKKLGFVVSALLFTLFHITSSISLMDLLFIIPYLLMTSAFSYGFFKTNNIYMSIITHAINNTIAFMVLLLM